jgi:uncharacterized protein (TIGR03437 family)
VQADASDQAGGGAFQVKITVEYVNPAQVPAECAGRGGLMPTITSGGVVGAGLSLPAVQQASPNGLISIFGQNFAPAGTSRAGNPGDLENGVLPVNLACTCVSVNQHLAPIFFVSPQQINVQTPAFSEGTASVKVIANCSASGESSSSPQSVAAQTAAPEFFYLAHNASGPNPVVAFNAVTGSIIGPTGGVPGIATAPARPGDYVAIYATGLGLTDPVFGPGVLANQGALTDMPVSVSLNGQALAPTDILYAGAAPGYAGVYQINIRVPAGTPAGNLPVSLNIDGIATPADALLAVGQ